MDKVVRETVESVMEKLQQKFSFVPKREERGTQTDKPYSSSKLGRQRAERVRGTSFRVCWREKSTPFQKRLRHGNGIVSIMGCAGVYNWTMQAGVVLACQFRSDF